MLYDQVVEATKAIQARSALRPRVAIILGSGLGNLVSELSHAVAIPYAEIPHFAHSTVSGHVGRLLIGKLEELPVVVMQGRFHFYEGYEPEVTTLPVRVMHMLGAELLIATNAAGGVNPAFKSGDFMLLRDHIYLPGLAGINPLVGPNDERFGERFPAIANAYDSKLRELARSVAATIPEVRLHEGVYTMVAGPGYETAAELRFLRAIGTDAVGMSTAPEIVVARHMGMKTLGLSLITNAATGEEEQAVNHAEVLRAADGARIVFIRLMCGIARALARNTTFFD